MSQSRFSKGTSCDPKVGYDTHEEARRSLKRKSRKNKRRYREKTDVRGKVYIYHCRFCNDFHVGHDMGRAIKETRNITRIFCAEEIE